MRQRIDNPRAVLTSWLRQHFPAFLRKAYPTINGGQPLMWNWHLDALCHHLDRVAKGETLRSMITMPPRNLKTIAVSVAWVAWQLGQDPTRNFVCVSYSTELSAKFGRECLAIMQSAWYRELFPATIISSKRSAAHDFETTRGGGRLSTSVTGTLTGRGGDIIIIDDPIKPDEASSEAARDSVNNWYRTTLSSRLNNKASGAIIVVMQRLHENDLAGMLLTSGGWALLKLAAIAPADEFVALGRGRFYNRSEGEPLHADRESIETLEKERASIGSGAFAAQYLQDPLPAVGNIIKLEWLQTYDPTFNPSSASGQIVQSWDTASKEGAHNDLSVCITAHVNRREIRILHVFRARLDFPKLKHQVIELARSHRASNILIEDQASGTALLQVLRSEKPFGVAAPIGRRPETDKVSRMMGVSGQIEAGQLFLPPDAPWIADFKAELLGFPNTRHDDQCDALSQLMNWVMLRETLAETEVSEGPVIITVYDDHVTETDKDGERFIDMGHYDEDPWGAY